MADIVSSLFGLSPMDTQQQIEQEDMRNALAIANLPQGKRAAYTGQLLGAKLSRGLLGAFGVQDPRLQKATAIEESLKEVNDNLTDEEKANPALLYTRLADSLAAKGLQQESVMARAKAQEASLAYSKAESDRLRAIRESQPEYIKLLNDRKAAELAGDTNRVSEIDKRLAVLATEGKSGGELTTDKLKAKHLEVLANPNSTEQEKATAKAALDSIYQYTNLPQGFERDPETGTIRPTVGGPQDIKLKEAEQTKFKGLKAKAGILATADDSFSRILSLASPMTTGAIGLATSLIPGEPGYNLKQALQTIKARLAFDALQEMRDLSKTGGALGNVSNQELKSLESAIASLDQGQSYEQFMSNLKTVQKHYNRLKEAVNSDLAAYEAAYAEKPQGGSQTFVAGRIYTDANGNRAKYNADNTWTPIAKGK